MIKPRLIIIAGPNGAGKTTITKQLRQHIWLDDTTYVNPDNIAQEKFGGWDNEESFIKAANYAQKIRENCLKNKESLVFETVFSTNEKIDFVKKAIDAGFFIRFFFIATNDPQINISRVVRRAYQSGHKVPANKIIDRHFKSILNCIKVINLVDRVYVYDNSVKDTEAELIFKVVNKDKQVVKQYQPMLDWTQIIFDNI